MFKFLVFTVALVVCTAVPPQPAPEPLPAPKPQSPTPSMPLPSPPVQTPRIFCGETPNNVLTCLDSPKLLNKSIARKCGEGLSECDRIKCIFRRSGWSTPSATADDTVNKQKVKEYFTQYAVDNPLWSPAVQHLKEVCLDKDLKAQGTTLNCAAYDVMHCITISFLRNASPFQWLNSTECAYPRAFAAACPICPSSCYAQQIPQGSCNACLATPTTA